MKWIVVVADPKTGQEKRGTIEASTRESAERKIQQRGLLLSSIEAVAEVAQSQIVVRKAEATVVDVSQPKPANRNLVQCPACEQMISIAAASCPSCGHPMREPNLAQQAPAAAPPVVIQNVVSANSSSSAKATVKRLGGSCLSSLIMLAIAAWIAYWIAVHLLIPGLSGM